MTMKGFTPTRFRSTVLLACFGFPRGEVYLILGKELNCSMHTTVGAAKRVLATTVGKVSAARTHMPNLQIYSVT